MTSVIAWTALVVAGIAFVMVRRQARRISQLTDMYWQLKYEHGELKATVAPPAADPPPPQTAFVPLGSVKRQRD